MERFVRVIYGPSRFSCRSVAASKKTLSSALCVRISRTANSSTTAPHWPALCGAVQRHAAEKHAAVFQCHCFPSKGHRKGNSRQMRERDLKKRRPCRHRRLFVCAMIFLCRSIEKKTIRTRLDEDADPVSGNVNKRKTQLPFSFFPLPPPDLVRVNIDKASSNQTRLGKWKMFIESRRLRLWLTRSISCSVWEPGNHSKTTEIKMTCGQKKKKEKKRKTYGSSRNQLCCCLSTHFGHNFAKIQYSKRFRFQESLVQQNEPDTNHFYLRSSSTERGLNEVIQIS